MNNQTTKKTKNKWDWQKNFELLEEVQGEGVWVFAQKNTHIGTWLKYCRQQKEKLPPEHYARFQKMGFEWKYQIWEDCRIANSLPTQGMIVSLTEENPLIPDTINAVSKSVGTCPSVTTPKNNVVDNGKSTLNMKAVAKATSVDTQRPMTCQDTCKKNEVKQQYFHSSRDISNIQYKKQKFDNSTKRQSSASIHNLNVTGANAKNFTIISLLQPKYTTKEKKIGGSGGRSPHSKGTFFIFENFFYRKIFYRSLLDQKRGKFI